MGVSEEACELYVESDFESLKKRAAIREDKFAYKSKSGFCKNLDLLHSKAKDANMKRDQEQEFMMLFRFLQIYSKMKSVRDDKSRVDLTVYNNNANSHMGRLEHLKTVLKQRYEKKKKALENTSLALSPVRMFPISPQDTFYVPPNNDINKEDITSVSIPEKKSEFVQCEELYTLLKRNNESKKESLLIIDCRSHSEFEHSHLKYSDLVHIPAVACCRGYSAAVLQCSIKSEEAKKKWNERHSYDIVLLIDHLSTQEDIKKDPLLHINILYEIMTKWEVNTKYRNLCFLNGGFEEFEIRYPQFTTNPTRNLSANLKSRPDLLKHFKYPEVPDIIMKKPSEPPKPVIPSINRHAKPKTSFSGLKEFSEQEKVNQETVKEAGKERGEPAVTADVSSTPNPVGLTVPMAIDQSSINTTHINVTHESTIFPDPSTLMEVDDDSQGNMGEERLENSNDTSSALQSTKNSMSAEQRASFVSNLRKVKPKSSESSNLTLRNSEMDYSSSSDEEERVPLKKDGVGSGMRRSLSSPNIAKENDDESVVSPSFSRNNKPSYTPKSFLPLSLSLGEDPDNVYGKTQVGLTGLKNFANNCYMNSIIQCLSNTTPLVDELTDFKKTAVNVNSTTKGQVAKAFITALHSIWSGDVRVYSIRELKNLMGSYKEIFKGHYHQDSHEFLIILLEYLHEDLNIPREVTVLAGACDESGEKAWGEFRQKNESVVQRLFYGQERSSVTCTVCNHRSVTFDHFFNLFVPIPDRSDRPTLEECIQIYISGENIIWTCPKCKVDRKAVKKLDITRLPPILIIALKRFSHEVSWLEKKETLVTYPLEGLEMRNFTLPASEQRHTVYNLHALSTHTGSLRAGHYRAICQNHMTNKWYLFDDSSIHSISPQEVRNNPEVYILFYHAVK